MAVPTGLNINNYHYRRGGADVMYLEQSALFRSLGWDVAEFAMHHPQNEPSPWSPYFADEIDVDGDYSVIDKVVRAGRVVYSSQARRNLTRLLDDVDVDVAHAHNVYHHLSPAILPLLHKRGIPTVLTTHDLKLACPAYQMLTHDGICERCKGGRLHHVVTNRCIKGSLAMSGLVFVESATHRVMGSFTKSVDRFVSPSRFYIDKFVEWGMDRAAFTHIPNYVDPSRFEPSSTPGEAFVYFGRLAHEKGLATMIRAGAVAGVPIWLIGTGPDEERLRAVALECGAEVEFVGYLRGDALHDRIRAARATVLASEWYENGPVSVLESYALGRPVLGARIGGITEFVREGETGLTFTSGSVDELAAVMVKVTESSDADVAAMGAAGRRWVEESFTPERYVERLSSLYADLGVSLR